jgi:uncharacterized protein YjbI with pentapeptide repeats
MLYEIKHKITGELKFSIETSSWKLAVEAAIASNANLSYADLSYADLRSANLSYADLSYADLRYADLRYADLRYADLSSANLRSADLRSANLDLSCWPLACKSFNVKCDNRLVFQLSMHLCKLDCKTKEFMAIKKALKKYANEFHHVGQDVEKIK